LESCGSCRYYLAQDKPEAGLCRRYPPQTGPAVWIGEPLAAQITPPKAAPPMPRIQYVVSNFGGAFPVMDANEGWCGEYEPPLGSMN
jgi:hypothetical protein